MQHNLYAVGMSGEALIDRIIDNFINHVMQAGAVICIANIHPRAFTHSVQSFEDFDAIRPIFRACVWRILSGIGHKKNPA
jgi:hypothetical protein